MIEWIFIGLGIFVALIIVLLFAWYVIVSPSEAHLVVSPFGKKVCSSDETLQQDGGASYFAIWDWIPFIGRSIRRMDITIKELKDTQETYEKNQARYNVSSSLKYRIVDVKTAAQTFISDVELKTQLLEVVRASVRAVTIKYDVVDARAKKQEMAEEIEKQMIDDLNGYGLKLISFQLVDFQDTADSKIISDISKRREVEIEANTRKQNAEKKKEARIKEADAEELAKRREIEKDQRIGEKEQNKIQLIAEQEKIAKEKQLDVIRVAQVKQAEIDREQALVDVKKEKEVEAIKKEQKKLQGEGDRDRDIEQAKGEAAIILEKLLSEAKGKDELQKALNKFEDKAIRALTAEIIVAKDEAIGVQTAKSLEKADLRVFAGDGANGKAGFELGKLIEATSVGNPVAADALLNKLGRPNDLGLTPFGLMKLADMAKIAEKEKEDKIAKQAEHIKKAKEVERKTKKTKQAEEDKQARIAKRKTEKLVK